MMGAKNSGLGVINDHLGDKYTHVGNSDYPK